MGAFAMSHPPARSGPLTIIGSLIASLLLPLIPVQAPPPPPPPRMVPSDYGPMQVSKLLGYLDHIETIRNAVAYVEAQEAAQRPLEAPVTAPQATGVHSDAWWRGVSSCEQGGRDNPTYGYFSIMDGSAAGKSWADQETEANGIIGRYGDSAWAQSCVDAGYAAAPGG